MVHGAGYSVEEFNLICWRELFVGAENFLNLGLLDLPRGLAGCLGRLAGRVTDVMNIPCDDRACFTARNEVAVRPWKVDDGLKTTLWVRDAGQDLWQNVCLQRLERLILAVFGARFPEGGLLL